MLNARSRLCASASFAMLIVSAGINPASAEIAADEALLATSNRSTITGMVRDETGAALPGARISVEGTNTDTTSSLQGDFTLNVPAEGSVTLVIDYLGRSIVTRVVEAAERNGRIDIVLPAAGASDTAIVVVGASLLDNTARALNQQRQADNNIDVLSADAIGRFPDPNIAEALQRVPGVAIERDQGEGRYINVRGAPAEFSAVTIDGVTVSSVDPSTRAVDLDTIPSDIVSNIAVSKTLLPSQEADSIAGAIDISTRSPFDRSGFALTGMAGAGYNQFGDTSDYRASMSVGNRFGANNNFGALVSGSYSRTHRQPDNVENVWALVGPAGAQRYGVTETLFKDYDTKRERIAGTGTLEWRPTDTDRVYLRGSYARFEDDEYRNRLGILWTDGTLQPGFTDSSATYTNTRIEKQIRHRVQRNEIWTVVGGGEHTLNGGVLSYNAAYSKSDQTYPQRDELLFRSSLRPRQSYDFSGGGLPRYSLFETGEHLQIDRYAFRENVFRSNTTLNDEFSAQVRMDVPTEVFGHEATISFGGKYRDRNIDADEERFRDRRASAAPSQPLSGFLTDEPSRNFDYELGNIINGSLADAYFNQFRSTSERRLPQSLSADYRANEKILGIFGMARAEFNGTTVIAGLRVEDTLFRATTPLLATPSKTKYFEVFPNLTFRHEFSSNLIGRFALTRGINRPNFRQIVPRRLDSTEGNTVFIEEGNPNLRPTLSNNADIGLEYYIRPLGVISVSGFYKDLKDYRYTVTRAGTFVDQDGPRAALFTRPENAPNGKLYGFEVNWQQQFGFLPGFLGGFGVFANYTYTEANSSLSQPYAGRQRFPLPGQSKHMWNASLFYEKGPVNLRVAYTKRSDYLNEINADQPDLDLYWRGRGQLDVTGSVQLTPSINLFAEGKNLTNSAGERYYGIRERTYEYEKFGYTLFGGVRVKL
ncbi:TonB-dependent receptor [Sphingomonas mucosissima]|uniref:Colicin I receptor n=1 Tax=Sphingomonas mucosissima TaxID=370959 RepID=A0A245ZJK4_9SPHN|nr:TonB-dependent receptor [Sphingomonas mucosissima]OWK29920.1 colicin I receptor precursor [Sphingomonas mucosissima]